MLFDLRVELGFFGTVVGLDAGSGGTASDVATCHLGDSVSALDSIVANAMNGNRKATTVYGAAMDTRQAVSFHRGL
ncbi:MAG: hypothetical protein ACK5KM_04390 [Hyphomicrobiaceae bacterium]